MLLICMYLPRRYILHHLKRKKKTFKDTVVPGKFHLVSSGLIQNLEEFCAKEWKKLVFGLDCNIICE